MPAAEKYRQTGIMKRHVLITGGSRGIGAETVRVFARAGDFVSFFYKKNADAAEALIHCLSGQGFRVEGLAVDVTDERAIRSAVSRQSERFGKVDVVISNAGITSQGLITDETEENFRKMMDTHVTSLFFLTQAILPDMIRRKYGKILAVSSIWGMTGASCEVSYSAAKAAVIGYVKALAKEVGPSGISVNCVAPGVIQTDMLQDLSREEKEALEGETPIGRLGVPEDVANLLFFLASDQASFITGQTISPNGGLVI